MELKIIARIENDYTEKFGVPRQSGIVNEVKSAIVFESEFRNAEALRGIDGFSRLWLIWGFSEAERDKWSPTVRPPRLGGNERMGVFATRSPFRPNSLGLSCVALEGMEKRPGKGDVLIVSGADLMNASPIYDIKPYAPYADAYPDASSGFFEPLGERLLDVVISPALFAKVPVSKREALLAVLSHDPRPAYQEDSGRVYGMAFGGLDVRFTVSGGVLTVFEVKASFK